MQTLISLSSALIRKAYIIPVVSFESVGQKLLHTGDTESLDPCE